MKLTRVPRRGILLLGVVMIAFYALGALYYLRHLRDPRGRNVSSYYGPAALAISGMPEPGPDPQIWGSIGRGGRSSGCSTMGGVMMDPAQQIPAGYHQVCDEFGCRLEPDNWYPPGGQNPPPSGQGQTASSGYHWRQDFEGYAPCYGNDNRQHGGYFLEGPKAGNYYRLDRFNNWEATPSQPPIALPAHLVPKAKDVGQKGSPDPSGGYRAVHFKPGEFSWCVVDSRGREISSDLSRPAAEKLAEALNGKHETGEKPPEVIGQDLKTGVVPEKVNEDKARVPSGVTVNGQAITQEDARQLIGRGPRGAGSIKDFDSYVRVSIIGSDESKRKAMLNVINAVPKETREKLLVDTYDPKKPEDEWHVRADWNEVQAQMKDLKPDEVVAFVSFEKDGTTPAIAVSPEELQQAIGQLRSDRAPGFDVAKARAGFKTTEDVVTLAVLAALLGVPLVWYLNRPQDPPPAPPEEPSAFESAY